MTLDEAIRNDVPLLIEYQDMTLAVGDLFLGALDGKRAFAWTVPGWGRDPGAPCHAIVEDLHPSAEDCWAGPDGETAIHVPWTSGIDQTAEAEAIRQWHRVGAGGDRVQRRKEALAVIIDYHPGFVPDPEP